MGRPPQTLPGDLTRPNYRIQLWARGADAACTSHLRSLHSVIMTLARRAGAGVWNAKGVQISPHEASTIEAGAFIEETNALLLYDHAAPTGHAAAGELHRRLRQPPTVTLDDAAGLPPVLEERKGAAAARL